MTIREVGDAVEQYIRIEIASDTPLKVEAFVHAISELILDTAGDFDVAVSIHDCTPESQPWPL